MSRSAGPPLAGGAGAGIGPARGTAAIPASARIDGRDKVVSTLSRLGAVSRAELARHTALAPSTVSSIVSELLRTGVVVEVKGGPVPAAGSKGGRPATLLALHRRAGLAIGIDFGKRHLRVALADLAHNLLAERARTVPPESPASEGIRQAVELVDEVLSASGVGRREIIGVGMGLPGPVRAETGEVANSTILPGWVGVPARQEMAKALGLAVRVDNDANLGALSEWIWGAARGYDNVIYLKVAHGVGAGLIIGGRPFRGVGGTAGEIGHLVVDPSGPICRCGNRGCLEMFAGADSVLHALGRTHGTSLTLKDAIELAHQGDSGCQRALADAGQAIGTALATACNLINPQLVVVGGELAAAGELLLTPLRESLQRAAIRSAADDVDVVLGALRDRAEVLGAFALALRGGSPRTAANRR